MAFLLTRNETFIIISGNEARIFSSSSSSSPSLSLTLSLATRISCDNSAASVVGNEAAAGPGHQSEEAGESSSIPGQILSAALSHSGDLLAICDDYKTLKVWSLSNITKDGLSLLCQTTLARRSTALTFSPADDSLLVADKNGDAYAVQIPPLPQQKRQPSDQDVTPKRILGHLGMLLDIGVTPCVKFVLTCDRDEKIRVSHYPNAYNIHNFHLAHTQFVYRLCIPPDLPRHFISGGGDGSVIFWSFENPRPLLVVNTIQDLKLQSDSFSNVDSSEAPTVPFQVKCLEYSRGHLCVSFNDVGSILVYRVGGFAYGTVEATPVQTLQLPSSVWDCKFRDDGTLVVLLTEKPHFKRFRLSDEKRISQPFVETDAPDFSFEGVEDSIGALEWSLATATKAPSLFAVLTKSKIDNMKAYLETKEKRLAGGIVRWGGHSKNPAEACMEGEDEPKKIKTLS